MKFFLIIYLLLTTYQSKSQKISNNPFIDSITKSYSEKRNIEKQELLGSEFKNFNVIDIDGVNYSEKDLLGKTTFILFWFESCSPCKAAFPMYNEITSIAKADQKFQILSFTTDPELNIKIAAQENCLLFPIISFLNNVKGYPSFKFGYPLYLITDKKGIIRYIKSGGNPDKEKAKLFFDSEIIPVMREIEKSF